MPFRYDLADFVDPNAEIKGRDIPLEAINASTNKLNSAYEKNLAEMTKWDILAKNIKTLKGDEPSKQAAIDKMKNQLGDFATKGNWEHSGSVINQAARDFATNQDIQAASQSYNNAQSEIALQNEMKAKGIQYYDFGKGKRDIHQTVGADAEGNKSYNIYNPATETRLEHEQLMKQLVAGIHDKGWETGLSQATALDPDLKKIFLQSQAFKGIDHKDTKRVADALLQGYLSSNSGKQLTRAIQSGLEPTRYSNPEQEIRQRLYESAEPQVGMVENKSFVGNPLATAAKTPDITYEAGAEQQLPENDFIKGILDKSEKKDRRDILYGSGRGDNTQVGGFTGPSQGPSRRLNELSAQERGVWDNLHKTIPTSIGGKKLTNEDKDEMVHQYLSDFQNKKVSSVYGAYADSKDINNETARLENVLDDRPVFDVNEGKVITGSEFRKKYILDNKGNTTELSKVGAAVGRYSPDNAYYDLTGDSRFASPEVIQVGGQRFPVGSSSATMDTDSQKKLEFESKITSAKRRNIPTEVGDYTVIYNGLNNTYQLETKNGQTKSFPADPTSVQVLANFLNNQRK